MSGFLDSEQLEIECPNCRRKFKKSVRELKGAGVKCPKCSAGFETSQFKSGIDKAERSLKDLERELSKKINIKIKL